MADIKTTEQTIDGITKGVSEGYGLYNEIGAAYTDLINSNRLADAFSLKQAEELFARSGSELGVNSFARAEALNSLTSQMNNASAVTESSVLSQALSEQASMLSSLTSIETQQLAAAFGQGQAIFDQQMQLAQSEANTAQQEWQNQYSQNQSDAQAAQQEWQNQYSQNQSDAQAAQQEWQNQFSQTQYDNQQEQQQQQLDINNTSNVNSGFNQQASTKSPYDSSSTFVGIGNEHAFTAGSGTASSINKLGNTQIGTQGAGFGGGSSSSLDINSLSPKQSDYFGDYKGWQTDLERWNSNQNNSTSKGSSTTDPNAVPSRNSKEKGK